MNILSQILGHDGNEGPLAPRGVKSQGPQNFRHVTNGQIRRANVRRVETARRKAEKRRHAAWFAQRAEISTLRGQLRVISTLSDNIENEGFTPLQYNAMVGILAKHDSVDAAAARFLELTNAA